MLQCQSFPKKRRCFEETVEVEQNAESPGLYIIGALTITQWKMRPSEELWTQLKVNQTLFLPSLQMCNHFSICAKSSNSSNDPSHLFRVTFSPFWTMRVDAKRERFQ